MKYMTMQELCLGANQRYAPQSSQVWVKGWSGKDAEPLQSKHGIGALPDPAPPSSAICQIAAGPKIRQLPLTVLGLTGYKKAHSCISRPQVNNGAICMSLRLVQVVGLAESKQSAVQCMHSSEAQQGSYRSTLCMQVPRLYFITAPRVESWESFDCYLPVLPGFAILRIPPSSSRPAQQALS